MLIGVFTRKQMLDAGAVKICPAVISQGKTEGEAAGSSDAHSLVAASSTSFDVKWMPFVVMPTDVKYTIVEFCCSLNSRIGRKGMNNKHCQTV